MGISLFFYASKRERDFLASLGRKEFSSHLCREEFVRDRTFSEGCQRDHGDVRAWEGVAECLPGKRSIWAQV